MIRWQKVGYVQKIAYISYALGGLEKKNVQTTML